MASFNWTAASHKCSKSNNAPRVLMYVALLPLSSRVSLQAAASTAVAAAVFLWTTVS
jgi:hypothetical protein